MAMRRILFYCLNNNTIQIPFNSAKGARKSICSHWAGRIVNPRSVSM